jgi:thiosulfate reductase/polysulfide reductase chain A
MTDFPRRDFLKIGAVGIGGVTLKSVFGDLYKTTEYQNSKAISRTTRRSFRGFPTTCHACPAKCGIVGFVHRSKLMLLEGNPEHPENQGKICAKGLAGLNLTYDPERILFPLRRDGERGSGKWKKITWDEAINEILARLEKIRTSGNQNDFIIESGTDDLLAERFARAFNNCSYAKHLPDADPNSMLAHRMTWGADCGIPDVTNSTYVLVFGANPYENHPHFVGFARELIRGRVENRAKLVVFDPRLSNTAGTADEWFPITPGSDAFVVLSLANLILKNNRADENFIRNWSTIRIDELRQYLSRFSPKQAEKMSGISEEDLLKIAMEFARSDRPVAFGGRGISAQINGVQNQRAILLLNAVVGAIDRKGGYCLPPQLPELPEPFTLPPKQLFYKSGDKSYLHWIVDGKFRPKVYFSHLYNPVFTCTQPEELSKVLKDETTIPFYVAMDTHFTESASFADIFLPAATHLERWNVQWTSGVNRIPILALTRPVVQPLSEQITLKQSDMTRRDMLTTFFQPLGEARSIDDVCLTLSQKLGGQIGSYFNFKSPREYVQKVIERTEGLDKADGFRHLEQHGFWIASNSSASYLTYERTGFRTQSRKFEIKLQQFEKLVASALPSPGKITAESNSENDELVLVTFSRNIISSQLANCKYLAEIAHDNPLWIHPMTAEKKGIKNGDRVKLKTSVGEIKVKVWLTESIHPQAIALARDFGHWAVGNIAKAKKFKSVDPDTSLLFWEDKGNGVHVNSIISRNKDSIGDGQVWNGINVRILKV